MRFIGHCLHYFKCCFSVLISFANDLVDFDALIVGVDFRFFFFFFYLFIIYFFNLILNIYIYIRVNGKFEWVLFFFGGRGRQACLGLAIVGV